MAKTYEILVFVNRCGRWQARIRWKRHTDEQMTHMTDEYTYRPYMFWEIDALIDKIEEQEKEKQECTESQ